MYVCVGLFRCMYICAKTCSPRIPNMIHTNAYVHMYIKFVEIGENNYAICVNGLGRMDALAFETATLFFIEMFH